MSLQLVIRRIAIACVFGAAWTIQDWRYGAKETERVQQELADQRLAATTAIRRSDAVIQAQGAAESRARGLRADAAGARDALVSLHDSAASALRAAESSQAACLERAATFSELLDTVARAGGELAEKAGRHASDVQTLTEAWPR
jgi:hypothetical protein